MGFFDKLKIKYNKKIDDEYLAKDSINEIHDNDKSIEYNQKFIEKLDDNIDDSSGIKVESNEKINNDLFEENNIKFNSFSNKRIKGGKIKYKKIRKVRERKIRTKCIYPQEEKISFLIKNKDNEFMLYLKKNLNNASLSFRKGKNLKEENLDKDAVDISLVEYEKFVKKVNEITKLWQNHYQGINYSNTWELIVDTKNNNSIIDGNGDYPYNWNDLIDLVSEYELKFKQKNNDTIKKETIIEPKVNKIETYLEELNPEINKKLKEMHLLIVRNGKEYSLSGCCYAKWNMQKKLLKERYNIDWESPLDRDLFLNC